MFEVDGLLRRESLLLQPSLQPAEDAHERRVLVAQALRELDDEGAVEVFAPAQAIFVSGSYSRLRQEAVARAVLRVL